MVELGALGLQQSKLEDATEATSTRKEGSQGWAWCEPGDRRAGPWHHNLDLGTVPP